MQGTSQKITATLRTPLDEGSVTMSTKRGSRQSARCRYVSRTVVVAYDIEVGDAANAVVKVLTIHR